MKNYLNRFTAFFFLSLTVNSFVSAVPIDEVKIVGAPPEQVEALKTLSGFLPGDEVEEVRVNRSIGKLKEYFETKGYPQAKVHYLLLKTIKDSAAVGNQNVLQFDVTLGMPIRISSLEFVLKNGDPIPADLQRRLNGSIDFKPNEPDDRDRIKEMRRNVEASLANLNFVDSRVVNILTEGNGNEVRVTFVIELGQKVIFSVYGNEYFTRTELMNLIEEQKAVGLGRDYVNVILGRLRDFYVDAGYRYVEIIPYTFESKKDEPRKVAYHLDEKFRVSIKHLSFDGNETFSDEVLENLFFKNAPDRIQAKIYNAKMVEESAKGMIEAIKGMGYLSAKLIAIKTVDVDGGKAVDLKIFVSEGLQTHVQGIEFHGNQVFSSEKLTEFLGFKEGSPLSLIQLENGIDRIKKEYRNLGRLNMSITNELSNQIVTYSEKNQFAYLNFDLDEGTELRLSSINIFGNETTRKKVIEREIQIKVGEPLAADKILETEERLRRLGIFSQVAIDLQNDPDSKNTKNMKVSVQEGTPGNVGAGFGYRNDLGVRVFSEFTYANLWGQNQAFVLNVSGNRRLAGYHFTEYSVRASYLWPYFMLGETIFRPSLTAEERQYNFFDAQTYAASANFERMLYKPLKWVGGLTYTLERVKQFNARSVTDDQEVQIGSITPSLRLDLRDNPLVPRKGFFAQTSFEYANPLLGSQHVPYPVSYGRFQTRADFYSDIIPRVVLYGSARGGWIRNFISPYRSNGTYDQNVSIPLIKQFTLGGVTSMRGYVEQSLNAQATDPNRKVVNFETYVNYRTQMDFLVSSNLSFGPFLDAGNVQVDNFSLGFLRYGTGAGLRYLTPIGPVNFDWGFNLFPRQGEETNVFYFSIGVI